MDKNKKKQMTETDLILCITHFCKENGFIEKDYELEMYSPTEKVKDDFTDSILKFESTLYDFVIGKTSDESLFDCVEYFCIFDKKPLSFKEYFEKTLIGSLHKKIYCYDIFDYESNLSNIFTKVVSIKYVMIKDGIFCIKTKDNEIKIRVRKTKDEYLKKSLYNESLKIISQMYNKI